jgi:hypothetical protein
MNNANRLSISFCGLGKDFWTGLIVGVYNISCKALLESVFNMYVLSAVKDSLAVIS